MKHIQKENSSSPNPSCHNNSSALTKIKHFIFWTKHLYFITFVTSNQ